MDRRAGGATRTGAPVRPSLLSWALRLVGGGPSASGDPHASDAQAASSAPAPNAAALQSGAPAPIDDGSGEAGAAAASASDAPCAPSTVVGLLNIGGWSNLTFLLNSLQLVGAASMPSVVVILETHVKDALTFINNPSKWGLSKIISRGYTGGKGNRSGVAIGLTTDELGMGLAGQDPKGGLAVVIWHKKGLWAPFAIVAAYLPTEGSKYVADRAVLLDWSARQIALLRARLGDANVIFATDANGRVGDLTAGRASSDPTTGAPPNRGVAGPDRPPRASAWAKHFAAWLRANRLRPAHGYGGVPAPTTSRGVTKLDGEGSSEVDYICVLDGESDKAASAMAPPAWGPAPSGASHRLCLARHFHAARTGGPAPRRTAPMPRAPRMRPYGRRKEWHQVQVAVDEALWSVEHTVEGLEEALQGIARSHAAPARAPIDKTPTTNFKGRQLAAPIVQHLELAERLRRAAQRLPLGQPAADALAVAQRFWRSASRAVRSVRRQFDATVARTLEDLRTSHAHEMHAALRRFFPETPGLADHEGDADDAARNAKFAAFFEALGAETRAELTGEQRNLLLASLRGAGSMRPARDSRGLSGPVTPDEVYASIYPTVAGKPPLRPCPKNATCATCDGIHKRWKSACDDRQLPMPAVSPTLHTSTATGADGIPAELLRFAAPDGGGAEETLDFRMRVCKAVATALNSAIAADDLPSSFTRNVSVALRKSKAGGDVDDADGYRLITLSNYFAKVLDAVLTRRITHWATRNKLIAPEQIGFMVNEGAEQHVCTLNETCAFRKRRGLETYLLFVDLRKAYDMVHHSRLWLLLEHLGVPGDVRALLARWIGHRRTQLRATGADAASWPVEKGTPQGGIMSPILFDIFIEPLSRSLKSLAAFHGVDVLGCVVRHLLYADDLVVVADSPEQLQRAATAIAGWCALWGMEANISPQKTAAMRVRAEGEEGDADDGHDAALAAVTWPAGREPGCSADAPDIWPATVVPYVRQYRYLGFPMRADLDDDGFTGQQLSQLHKAWERYFVYNPSLTHSNLTLQLQLLSVCVLSTTTYLRGVILRTKAECEKIDVVVRRALRRVLRAPRGTPNLLLAAHFGVMPAAATQAQERERVVLRAAANPTGVLSGLLAALRGETGSGEGHPPSFPGRTQADRNKEAASAAAETAPVRTHATRRATAPPPATRGERVGGDRLGVIREAGQPVRGAGACALDDDQRQGRHLAATYGKRVAAVLGLAEIKDTRARPAERFTDRPDASTPRRALICAMSGALHGPAHVGLQPAPVALSSLGHGTRGSLLRLANRVPGHAARLIAFIGLGPAGLALAPFTRPSWADKGDGRADEDVEDDYDDADDGDDEAGLEEVDHGNTLCDRECRLCGVQGSHEDFYHLAFECEDVRMRIARVQLDETAKAMLRAVVDAARSLLGTVGGPLAGLDQALTDLIAIDVDSRQGRAVVYRLLCGFPFGARAVDAATDPLAHVLGRVFDAFTMPTHELRPMASRVVAASARHVKHVAEHWRNACAAQRDATARVSPEARARAAERFPYGSTTYEWKLPRAAARRFPVANTACDHCEDEGAVVACALCNIAVCSTEGHDACGHAVRPPAVSEEHDCDEEWLCTQCSLVADEWATALAWPPPEPLGRA